MKAYRWYLYVGRRPIAFYGKLENAKQEAKRLSSRYDDTNAYRIVRMNESTVQKKTIGIYRNGIYRTALR